MNRVLENPYRQSAPTMNDLENKTTAVPNAQ